MGRPGKGDVWTGPWRTRDPLIAAIGWEKIQGLRKLQAHRQPQCYGILKGGGWGRGGETAKRQITEDLKSLAKDAGIYFMKGGTTIGFSDHKWDGQNCVLQILDGIGRNRSQGEQLGAHWNTPMRHDKRGPGARWTAPQEGGWWRRYSRAESAGGRQKKSLKAKRKANMFCGFKVSYTKRVIPCVSKENQRKEEAQKWGPWEDAVLSSERLSGDAYRAAMGRGPQAARRQSRQTEARIYESEAQTRQLHYQSSGHTVITSSLSPGLFRN